MTNGTLGIDIGTQRYRVAGPCFDKIPTAFHHDVRVDVKDSFGLRKYLVEQPQHELRFVISEVISSFHADEMQRQVADAPTFTGDFNGALVQP